MNDQGMTFRVFISSAFSDLIQERDALSKHVWPRLSDECAALGHAFRAVDLRW